MGYSALPVGGSDQTGLVLSSEWIVNCEADGIVPGDSFVLIDEDWVATAVFAYDPATETWHVEIGGGPSDDDIAASTRTAVELTTPQYTCVRTGNSLNITRSDEKLFTVASSSANWSVVF